ncbi:hypothetical protein AB0M97_25495 [Streptomyces sp. NPDC051207]|uniref:hypothetical protein n=1 Tax=Streptomyces sp. NPDC051207 TaxID=3154641 RepID=UPI003412286F
MVVDAAAGTGKTSTLVMTAERMPDRGLYTTFTKASILSAQKGLEWPKVRIATDFPPPPRRENGSGGSGDPALVLVSSRDQLSPVRGEVQPDGDRQWSPRVWRRSSRSGS